MRFGAVCLAVLLAAAGPAFAAKELKPKFGDIDGPYYTEVSENREACRAAIRNSIALCRQNISFESNTKNRKYAGCLPIFRQQAESCVVHFRHQMSKCELSGAVRITSYSGFSCTPTKTVVEEDGDPGVTPADRRMKARTQSNVRAGPGTNFRIVGSLRTGEDVHVTGEAGDWLRIEGTAGTAFVHRSLLVQSQAGRPARTKQSSKLGWIVAENQPCEVWKSLPVTTETVTWSGDCVGGKASGAGRLVGRTGKGTSVYEGELRNGKLHGRGSFTSRNGSRYEGEWRNGKMHGRGTLTWSGGSRYEGEWQNGKEHGRGTSTSSGGSRYEGEWQNGKEHGRGTFTWSSGSRYEGEWRNGKPHGNGTYRTKSGGVYSGNWNKGCFESRNGRWAALMTSPKACGFK